MAELQGPQQKREARAAAPLILDVQAHAQLVPALKVCNSEVHMEEAYCISLEHSAIFLP